MDLQNLAEDALELPAVPEPLAEVDGTENAQSVTVTPFQNATWSLIWAAASFGCG